MKVFAVIGGYDYGGEDFDSLRLFDCFSSASAYLVEVEADYDYSRLETREIIMESALVTA